MEMRAAHRPHQKRVGRPHIRAEPLRAIHLGLSIQPPERDTHRVPICPRGPRRQPHHRIDDLGVAGAAAEHARKGHLNIRPGRSWIGTQKLHRRHHHAGRADAALRRPMVQERGLQFARQHRLRRLQRLDPGPIHLRHGHQTGADLRAVDQHRTGSAIAGIAADLHAL